MRALRRRLAVLARGRMPVILEGETGTGKSFLAERFVHDQSGRLGPFVVLQDGKVRPLGSPREIADYEVVIRLEAGESRNVVANATERQYMLELFRRSKGDFGAMAERLLGDRAKGRAVRLRFNQLGLKVRELSR